MTDNDQDQDLPQDDAGVANGKVADAPAESSDGEEGAAEGTPAADAENDSA